MAGFLIGILTGAALAMMIAPQTGEETRDLVLGKTLEAGNVAKDAASGVYSRGKQVIDAARSQVTAAVDEGKSAADVTKADLSQQAVTERPAGEGL